MAPSLSFASRQRHLQSLSHQTVDLVVIGGGITGAGIAWEAALRGLKVVLVEKNDFASGTSSKSSKLLHGGLRYLEHGELRLVFESLAQRNRLFQDAPQVASPLSFLFPIFRGGFDKGWKINAGLWLYDVLSGLSNWGETRLHRFLRREQIARSEPRMRQAGLKGAFRYSDGLTEDARLVIETLKSAVAEGAVALNYVEVTGLLKDADGRVMGVSARDALSGEACELKALRVVNAAGPWVDALLRLDDPTARRRLRPTKGVHVLTEAFVSEHAVVMRSTDPAEKVPRVLFVIPWGRRTLIGTTDTDPIHDSDNLAYLDEDVDASEDEVRYLLDAVNAAFDVRLTPGDVLSSFAGWRPLIAPADATVSESATSREHDVFTTASGLVSIAGGKLTAYRTMARQAVDEALKGFSGPVGPSRIETRRLLSTPQAGQSLDAFVDWYMHENLRLPKRFVATLARRYGAQYALLRDRTFLDESLAQPLEGLDEDLHHYRVEVWYAVAHEGALTLADFLMRRTRLHLLDHQQALRAAEPTAELMASFLAEQASWDDQTRRAWVSREVAAYGQIVARNRIAREPVARKSAG